MPTLLFYVINVLAIALPLALFEIWLERFKSGFGGEFYSPFWGAKLKIPILGNVMEKAYITPYHLIMFAIVIPGIFVSEFLLIRQVATHAGWVFSFRGVSVVPALFFPALWIGVATLEDFFWFALNWRYRDALQRLFRAEMAWHTKWIHVTPTKQVPRFYIANIPWVAALLTAQHIVTRLRL